MVAFQLFLSKVVYLIIRRPPRGHFLMGSQKLVQDVTTKHSEHFSAFVVHLYRRNMDSQSSSDTDTRSSTSSPLSDDHLQNDRLSSSNWYGFNSVGMLFSY